MDTKDIIVFMSAYKTTQYKKSVNLFRRRISIPALLSKYQLHFVMDNKKIISTIGEFKLDLEYDYVRQSTSFSFSTIDENNDVDRLGEFAEQIETCIKLYHAKTVLLDSVYFNIDFMICMEKFLVYIEKSTFQIDPLIFFLNGIMIISFKILNVETGSLLTRDDILGKLGNFNLLKVNGYQFINENSMTPINCKITEVIYENISGFFSELTGESVITENYSFIHNTLVLLKNIDDIGAYFCKLIGTRETPSLLENISTTDNYKYYPQDGCCIITDYDSKDVSIPLYNGIILESIKMYIYLEQIIHLEIISDINSIIRNNLYLESLFFAPQVPIETNNLLRYIYKTTSFQHHKEAILLKISYMEAVKKSKVNRNSVFLNILLYILSLIGSVGTLDILEKQLDVPFKYSFPFAVILFIILGITWGVAEWHQNKKF